MLLDELLIKIGVDLSDADKQIAELSLQLLDLMDAAESGDLSALQSFAEKTAEIKQALDGMGEKAQEDWGGLVDLAEQASAKYQTAAEEIEKVAQQTVQFGESAAGAKPNIDEGAESVEKLGEKAKETKESAAGLLGTLTGFIASKFGIDTKAFGDLRDKIKQAREESEKSQSALMKFSKTLGLVGDAIITATGELTAFVSVTLDELDEVEQISRKTKIASEDIMGFSRAAETAGSSVEAGRNSIEGLSRVLGEAYLGVGRGAKMFEEFGLSAKDSNGDIRDMGGLLEEIQAKISGMSMQAGTAMLSKLGMDESLIQLMNQSTDDYKKAMERAKALTLDTAKYSNDAADFKDALAEFGTVTKSLAVTLAGRLAPVLTRIYKGITDWVLRNQWLVRGIEFLGDALGLIIDFIRATFNVIDNLVERTIGWKWAIVLLGGALLWLARGPIMAVARALFMTPIGIIVAAIALLDDFFTYLDGGESLLGGFWEPLAKGWRKIGAVWEEFKATWNTDPIKAAFSLVTTLITTPFQVAFDYVLMAWNALTGQNITLDGIKAKFEEIKQTIIDKFKAAFDWVTSAWDKVKGIWDSITGFFGDDDKKEIEVTQKVTTEGVTQKLPSAEQIVATAQTPMPTAAMMGSAAGINNQTDNRQMNSNNKYTITQNFTSQGTLTPSAVADATMQSVRMMNNQRSTVAI